ncbi:protein mesh-like isoform X2 [Crassostrea virginica]
MQWWVFIVSCLLLQASSGNDLFYPYGRGKGDVSAPINDDGSSPEIPISTLFPFFDHQHDHLIVNTNGVISFLSTVSTFTPDPFPLDGDRRLVAAFWGDVDTRKGGVVLYRESTDPVILKRASLEIRTYFPKFFRFQATWVFIATWDHVAFYGCTNCEKRNTFQEVLITNGQHSFTIFNYGDIEWTTGTASGGDAESGLGGTPAQVGFNAGDGKVFYVVNASRTPDIINITYMSNINIPGKFAFRIDSAQIGNGGCSSTGTLTIAPRYGPMLGGQYLVVGGPCINPNDDIQIKYSPMMTSFPCQHMSSYSAVCITPMFNTTGDIQVTLSIENSNAEVHHHRGIYTIVNPAIFNSTVRRHLPHEWFSGRQYNISWDPLAFELKESNRIHIHLFALKEHGYNDLKWEKTILHENIEKEVSLFALNLQSDGHLAAIRVTSAVQTDVAIPERGLWTDIFAVVPSHQQSRQFCYNWIRTELRLPPVPTDDTPPCPCTLQQALMDTVRYQPDPDCNSVTRSRDADLNCLYRANARHCVRLSEPGLRGKDNVCCYGTSGNLLDSRVEEGGTLQRYHYLGGRDAVPYVTNLYYDVLPFLHCCRYFGPVSDRGKRGVSLYSECQDYIRFRNISSCYNYVPPRPAGARGDPHLKTLDGLEYSFNGVGEFHFILSKNASFESQIRFERAKNTQGGLVDASVCTAFVAEVTNSTDRVEVRLNPIRTADVIINSHAQDFTDVSWLRYRGKLSGLLGDFDGEPGNDLRLPNGTILDSNTTEETIYRIYNSAWRITRSESLFSYPVGKNYSDYNGAQQRSFVPMFKASLLSSASPEERELCGNNTDCLFDFNVTGSRVIAIATRAFSVELEEAEDAAVIVLSCPILPSTTHGIWVANNTMENATAVFYCNMGYRQLRSCGKPICRNGIWQNLQRCSCEEIPTVSPSSTIQTGQATPLSTTPKDNAQLLRSISSLSDKIQMMWITMGTGVLFIVVVVLITSLVICFKTGSRGRYADHDKHTVSSSRSSSNPRRLPRSHDSIMTKTSHVSSNNTGNSRGGLPRYDVYDNRAFAVSEAGPRSAEHPSGRHQPYGVLY